LPPGPDGLPIIGYLLSMPTTEEWLHWSKLSERFGSIVSVSVLGQPIVVLNTFEACVNLLDKRSSAYSGRPILTFAGNLIGWDRQMILCEDGERHKAMRRMFARHIGTHETVSEYHDLQEKEAKRFLVAASSDSDHLLKHIRLSVSAMFLKITHGYSIERASPDPLISLVEKAAEEFYIAAAPGAWLVDIFPWLQHLPRWLPGTQFKDVASRLRETCINQTVVPIQFVKEQMERKEGTPCFTSHILETERTPMEEEIYPYIATSLYAGGQDTISATLGTFFLAMLLYPDIQRRAQAELDEVLDRCRLPS
ncbi:cytochrome P450, partial [Peniophora sp. CONT]